MIPGIVIPLRDVRGLSVPYFTGLVMILTALDLLLAGYFSFSPLFYGISDDTTGSSCRPAADDFLSVPYFTGLVMIQS